jgi:hypothetical protein
MTHRQSFFCSLLIMASLLSSCDLLKKKKPQQPMGGPVGQATLIGMIEMVNPEQNYVVIRSDAPPSLAAGTELMGLSAEGNKSKLMLSPERKGFYLTADIKEGNPMVSDLVLLPRESLETKADSPPPPATPPATPAPEPSLPQKASPAPANSPTPPTATPPAPLTSPAAASKPATPISLDDLEPPVGNP